MSARYGQYILFYVILGLISTSEGVNCEHCGKYFKVLGRHIWRCKARLSTTPLQSTLGNGHGTAQEIYDL